MAVNSLHYSNIATQETFIEVTVSKLGYEFVHLLEIDGRQDYRPFGRRAPIGRRIRSRPR